MKTFERRMDFPILIFSTLFGNLLAAIILTLMPFEGDTASYLGYLLSPIVLSLAAAVFYVTRKIPLKTALPVSFDIKTAAPATFAIAGFFAAAILPAFLMAKAAESIGIAYSVEVPAPDTPIKIFLSVIVLALMPAIGEEIFFRKAVHDVLDSFNPIQIALISGLVFALWHMNLAQTVHQFFLGVFLSLVMQRTKSILYPILLHIINNLLAVFLSDTAFFHSLSLSGAGLIGTLALFFAGIAIFLISSFFLFRKKGRIDMIKKKPGEKSTNPANGTLPLSPGAEKENIDENKVLKASRIAAFGTLVLLAAIWLFVVILSLALS